MSATALPLPVLGSVRPHGDAIPQPPKAQREERAIGYARFSLTRGCSMRCTYCRPAIDRNPRDETRLTPAEIARVAQRLGERHGVRKVRLTGGDPTVRPDLPDIVERLAALPATDDLAMTTNGLTLARDAARLASLGLGRVNVSLDTLDPDRFEQMTGVDGLRRVLKGVDAALAAGLAPVKLNCVVVRGQNDHDLPALVGFAADRGLELRFIELMPMGPLAPQWARRYVTGAEMRERLASTVAHWRERPQGRASAQRFHVTLRDGRRVTLGFITPMSCNFCAACDRIRIGADGGVYPCLMDRPRGSILGALRPSWDPDAFDGILDRAYLDKAPEHPEQGFATMTHIGG
ncbi:MAG: GTP 3',8-cyclase MoaA [Planctomycetota bacterium]